MINSEFLVYFSWKICEDSFDSVFYCHSVKCAKKVNATDFISFFFKFKLNIDQKLNLHIATTNKTTWIENKNEIYWKTMENIKLVINTIKAGCVHLDLSYIIWYYFIARISIEKCSSDFDTFMKIWLKNGWLFWLNRIQYGMTASLLWDTDIILMIFVRIMIFPWKFSVLLIFKWKILWLCVCECQELCIIYSVIE